MISSALRTLSVGVYESKKEGVASGILFQTHGRSQRRRSNDVVAEGTIILDPLAKSYIGSASSEIK